MSPVIKYDVSKVDPSGASTPVKPGNYKFKVKSATYREEKNDIQVVATIQAGKFKGVDVFTWVNFGEASAWKLREFTDALGMKPKGGLDPDKLTGKTFTALTDRREYQGEMRNGIKSFLKPDADEEDEPDEADIEEEEDEDDEDLMTNVDEDDDDDDEEEDEDEEDDEEEDEDEEDFESMDDDELREEAEARGLKTTGSRRLLLKRLEKDAAKSSDKPF